MADEQTVNLANRARSFGSVAESYDRFRPPPPMAAVEWVLTSTCGTALELGAGTGALTRRLAERAAHVIAVEPDPRMLAVLAGRSPAVHSVRAVAEHLPIAASTVDAVMVSSAWHWMDPAATVGEVGRVLRSGGVLGIVGNGPDRSVEWVGRVLGSPEPTGASEARARRHRVALPPGAPFDDVETYAIPWSRPMHRDELVGLVGTYSSMITMPPDQRATELQRIEAFVDHELNPGSRDVVEVPMVCRCWRAVRR